LIEADGGKAGQQTNHASEHDETQVVFTAETVQNSQHAPPAKYASREIPAISAT
jgi:hypothetical protein